MAYSSTTHLLHTQTQNILQASIQQQSFSASAHPPSSSLSATSSHSPAAPSYTGASHAMSISSSISQTAQFPSTPASVPSGSLSQDVSLPSSVSSASTSHLLSDVEHQYRSDLRYWVRVSSDVKEEMKSFAAILQTRATSLRTETTSLESSLSAGRAQLDAEVSRVETSRADLEHSLQIQQYLTRLMARNTGGNGNNSAANARFPRPGACTDKLNSIAARMILMSQQQQQQQQQQHRNSQRQSQTPPDDVPLQGRESHNRLYSSLATTADSAAAIGGGAAAIRLPFAAPPSPTLTAAASSPRRLGSFSAAPSPPTSSSFITDLPSSSASAAAAAAAAANSSAPSRKSHGTASEYLRRAVGLPASSSTRELSSNSTDSTNTAMAATVATLQTPASSSSCVFLSEALFGLSHSSMTAADLDEDGEIAAVGIRGIVSHSNSPITHALAAPLALKLAPPQQTSTVHSTREAHTRSPSANPAQPGHIVSASLSNALMAVQPLAGPAPASVWSTISAGPPPQQNSHWQSAAGQSPQVTSARSIFSSPSASSSASAMSSAVAALPHAPGGPPAAALSVKPPSTATGAHAVSVNSPRMSALISQVKSIITGGGGGNSSMNASASGGGRGGASTPSTPPVGASVPSSSANALLAGLSMLSPPTALHPTASPLPSSSAAASAMVGVPLKHTGSAVGPSAASSGPSLLSLGALAKYSDLHLLLSRTALSTLVRIYQAYEQEVHIPVWSALLTARKKQTDCMLAVDRLLVAREKKSSKMFELDAWSNALAECLEGKRALTTSLTSPVHSSMAASAASSLVSAADMGENTRSLVQRLTHARAMRNKAWATLEKYLSTHGIAGSIVFGENLSTPAHINNPTSASAAVISTSAGSASSKLSNP